MNEIKGPSTSDGDSPVLPVMDEKIMAFFPSGKPREDTLETVICKVCKKPFLKPNAAEHTRGCVRAKQEKAKAKKEAREAAIRQKQKAEKGDNIDDEADTKDESQSGLKSSKGAKKSAVKDAADDGSKKGKKRKADAGDQEKDKEPKKKKKKDEPKPKVAKPKGPVDFEKQCGVTLPNGGQCARSLTCKSHSMGAKRGVPRRLPYDMLLQAYQKKNQARQQSEFSS